MYRSLFPLMLFGIVLLGCSGSEEDIDVSDTSAGEALAVEGVLLTHGRLIEEIETSGTLEGIREATIVSETEGVINEVGFEIGHTVEPQDTLVQVDDEIARLTMEQAREQLEIARIDLRTKESLLERGGASRAEVLRSRSAVQGAEAQYRRAVKEFENCSISSPIFGSVASKSQAVSVGNYLSRGSRVARVVDLSSLRMEVSLGEAVIGMIEVGARAELTVPAACEERVFAGRVSAVAAGSDPGTGSYPVILEWENECPVRIKSGMSAEAVITPREVEPVLIVPSSAVVYRGGTRYIFIAEERARSAEHENTEEEILEARMKEVSLGRRLGNRTELRAGAGEGDILILTGISGLSEGDPVRVSIVGESGQRP